jgi:alanine-synthesizing transaminase
MGNPDLPTPPHVLEKLETPASRGRSLPASRGIGLRKAQAAHYGRRFGVKLNPDTQIVATLARRRALPMAQATTRPATSCCAPTELPSRLRLLMAGGVIRSVPSEPTP